MKRYLTRDEAVKLAGLEAVEAAENTGAYATDRVMREEDGIEFVSVHDADGVCVMAYYYQSQAERDENIENGWDVNNFENWTVDHYEVEGL